MATVILLTAAQADAIRGPSGEAPALAALKPVQLTDGRYILGVEVLSDTLHTEYWPLLEGLPRASVEDIYDLIPRPLHE
ncbi:MAG: hypothetical protein HQ465_13065 [Rhodospirillales bacterium]|nr:hypothetical protein [Rhodospirillales bacterium]